jgi:hypothetical protein
MSQANDPPDAPTRPTPKPADVSGHFDPTEGEKTFFRHRETGNLGWRVVRDGVEFVRLDRPMEEILFPLLRHKDGTPILWAEEDRPRLLGPGQAARISFEAYKALCAVTGKPTRAAAEWISMSEQARIDYSQKGPRNGTPLEMQLHRAIMGVLKTAT